MLIGRNGIGESDTIWEDLEATSVSMDSIKPKQSTRLHDDLPVDSTAPIMLPPCDKCHGLHKPGCNHR